MSQFIGRQTDVRDNPLVADYYPTDINNTGGPVVIKTIEAVDQTETGRIVVTPDAKGEIQVSDEYIIFWPSPPNGFMHDTSYEVTISGYRTISDKEIGTITLRFVIDESIGYSPLQTEVQRRYERPEGLLNDPILTKILHTEPYSFRISLVDEGKFGVTPHVILIETLVLQGRNESIESFEANSAAAKEAALTFIREQGVDTENDITIVYESNEGGSESDFIDHTEDHEHFDAPEGLEERVR